MQLSAPGKIETSPMLPPLEAGSFTFDVSVGLEEIPIGVRWGTREHLDWRVPLVYESRRYAALRFCIAGGGTFESGGESWNVRPGTAYWNTRGAPIKLTISPGTVSYVVLLFGTELDELFAAHLRSPAGAVALDRPEQVQRLMEALMVEGLTPSDWRVDNAASLARLLLRTFDAGIADTDPQTVVSRQTYLRVRQHIVANYHQISALPEIAAACKLTVPYICRLFERFDPASPYELLTALKIAQAERMLIEGRLPVSEVARAVGYADVKLFSRNFKARFGKSPRSYRQVDGAIGVST